MTINVKTAMTINVTNANADKADKGLKRIDVKIGNWMFEGLVINAHETGASLRAYIRRALEIAAKPLA